MKNLSITTMRRYLRQVQRYQRKASGVCDVDIHVQSKENSISYIEVSVWEKNSQGKYIKDDEGNNIHKTVGLHSCVPEQENITKMRELQSYLMLLRAI